MMKYDFDAIHNRRTAGDIKYNCPSDVIPMWVADMDFKVPDESGTSFVSIGRYNPSTS